MSKRIPTKARSEFVRELSSGVWGRILRRVWLIDRTTDAPAVLAYVVRFHDGREKRVLETDVEKENE